MKMDYRVLTEAERKYTFSQSQQLSMQTGLIAVSYTHLDVYKRQGLIYEESKVLT